MLAICDETQPQDQKVGRCVRANSWIWTVKSIATGSILASRTDSNTALLCRLMPWTWRHIQQSTPGAVARTRHWPTLQRRQRAAMSSMNSQCREATVPQYVNDIPNVVYMHSYLAQHTCLCSSSTAHWRPRSYFQTYCECWPEFGSCRFQFCFQFTLWPPDVEHEWQVEVEL